MIDGQDPWSRPPFAGSVSDRHWVRRNATLFGGNTAWSVFKGLLLAVVALVAVAFVSVLFGSTVTAVFVLLLVAALVVRGVRRQMRLRAQVPRW
jgi:Flp pilus assembly protein TadB